MTVAGPKRNREGNDAARAFVGRMLHHAADIGFLVDKARLADPPHGSLLIDKLLLSNSMRRPSSLLPVDMVRTAILRGGQDAIVVAWSKLIADRDRLAERSKALACLDELKRTASAAAKIDLQSLSEGQCLVAASNFSLHAFEARMREIKDLALMLSIRLGELHTPKIKPPSGENVLRRAYIFSVSNHWTRLSLEEWPRARSGWHVDILVAGWHDLGFPVKRATDLHSALGKVAEIVGNRENIEQ